MLTIIWAMGLLLHDSLASGDVGFVNGRAVYALAILLLPKILLLLIYQRLCRLAVRRPSPARLKRLDRQGTLLRSLLLACYAMDLATGCLTWMRLVVGDWVLLDEILLLCPTVVSQLLFWRLYYPVDRKLREAMACAAIDSDEPVSPIWSLRQYLLSHIRHSLLIPGVPLLLLLGWTETLNMAPAHWFTLSSGTTLHTPLSLAGTFVVFLFTPLMLRHLWDTQALPPSPMRSRLLELCKQYGVHVREILYWKTFGGMANGAVIGFVGPLRYILLTDVLLAQMPPSCIEAVMAHEIAHVRKKHMFWMIAGAGAMMVTYQLFFGIILWVITSKLSAHLADPESWQSFLDITVTVLGIVLAGGLWLVCFGWMSRRMERQADSFAVMHMANNNGHRRIEPEDAYAMIQALEAVARLNHVRTDKKSFRHGSIRWRQNYLQSLVNQPAKHLPIDRTMRWLCSLILIGVLISTWLLWGGIEQIQSYLTPPSQPSPVYVI